MSEIIQWMSVHPIWTMMIGIGVLEGIILLVILIMAHRVCLIKTKVDSVCEQVKKYLHIVLENEQENEQEPRMESLEKAHREEEENRIISTVLKEIFP